MKSAQTAEAIAGVAGAIANPCSASLGELIFEHGRRILAVIKHESGEQDTVDLSAREEFERLAFALGIARWDLERLSPQDVERLAKGRFELKLFQNARDVLQESETEPYECYVRLSDMAAVVRASKSTLEKRRKKNPLPDPVVKGGRGRAALWKWSDARGWLEKEFDQIIPNRFPGDPFYPS